MTKAIFREYSPSPDKWREILSDDCGAELSREVGSGLPDRRCPRCGSIIYTRRHKLCGVCASPLPGEFLFSAAEISRVERMLDEDKRKHRQWVARNFAKAVAIPC
jgi:hypothetical protein